MPAFASAVLPANATTYVDQNVAVGGTYEYEIEKESALYPAFGYIRVAINAPEGVRLQWSHNGNQREVRLLGEPHSISTELSLPMGLSRLTFLCSDASLDARAPAPDPAAPVAKTSQLQLEWAESATASR